MVQPNRMSPLLQGKRKLTLALLAFIVTPTHVSLTVDYQLEATEILTIKLLLHA